MAIRYLYDIAGEKFAMDFRDTGGQQAFAAFEQGDHGAVIDGYAALRHGVKA
ncbi:hypothetical protein D3C84_1304990 [compost metagenome]